MKRIFTIVNGSKKAAIVCFAVLFFLMMNKVGLAQTTTCTTAPSITAVYSATTCTPTTTFNISGVGTGPAFSSCGTGITNPANNWGKFTAIAPTANIVYDPAGAQDPMIFAYSGTCGGTLTQIGCVDDNGNNGNETLNLSGLTPGVTYFFRIVRYNSNSSMNGAVCISSPFPTITTGPISGSPFCAGSAVSVPFTTSSATFSGNTFTAQLSNATGSFASPTNIGTLVSNANSGTIAATIPAITAAGTGYRIRVISNSPAVTGSDNGTNFTVVNGVPGAAGTITGSATVCQGQNSVSYSVPVISNTSSYTWAYSGTGATISGTGNTVTVNYSATATSGNITVYGTNACGNGTVSANYAVTVNPLPVAAGTITGTATVCQGQNGVAYSVPAITNATGYVWTLPTGATIATGANTNSITVNYAATATSGNITVYGTNACGNGTVSANYAVTVNPLPVAAGTITGTATVCQGQNGVAYSVPAITNATGYVWTLPTGATIATGANTRNITVNYSATATSGNITVYGTNACGNGTVSANYAVTVNPLPVAAGTITGTATVCQGQNGVAYSVPAITNATGYVWTLPTGATIATGANTRNITVNYSATATSGNITVYGTNACGNGTVSANYAVTVNPLPVAAGTITGTATVCQGQNGVAYSVPAITNATGYVWTLPTGATIATGANTRNITVNYSATATSGNITVYGTNACGNGTVSANYAVTVNPLPVAAGTITGTATVCQGQNGVAYSVPAITNATGYVWTLPTGATIATGANTRNITVNYSATATSGNITVYGTNACGNGTVSANFSVTVNPLPGAAGGIVGSSAACQGQNGITYSVPAISNASSYTWAYSGTGVTINGTTNPVTINFSGSATSGILTVAGTNGCGNGVVSANFPITVYQPPTISLAGQPAPVQTICATFPVDFTVTATGDNLTYQWYNGSGPITDDGNITGSTTATLHIESTSVGDAGTYYVVVSGSSPCAAAQSNNAVLNVNQEIIINTQPTSQVVCNGSTAVFTVNASGTSIAYQWRKGTVALVDGGNISGATGPTLTITNASAADAAVNYNVLITSLGGICPQSKSKNVSLTVNPIPTVNTVSNVSACNGANTSVISFSGSTPGTVFNWSNDNTSIGLGANGTGNIASFAAVNTGTSPVTANITVTPSYTNAGVTCIGLPVTFTITVNPTATVNAVSNQVVCNGSPINAINFTSSVTGGTIVYNWTNNTPSIGLAASGTGDIAVFTATNSGTSPVTATITVTPSYTNGSTCAGTPTTFTITVNPTATVNAVSNQVICNNSVTAAVNFTTNVSGGTVVYNWENDNTAIGLAANGIGNIASFTATNTTNGTLVANITVTPSFTNGSTTCSGTPRTFTITVNPKAVVNTVANQSVCNGFSTTAINFTSPTTGGTIVYNWTNNNTTIGLGASGTGNIAAFIAINTGTAPVIATITVTPSYTNGSITCPGTPLQFTITVNPQVKIAPLAQEICNSASITSINISGLPSGTITSWTRDNPAGITSSIGISGSGPISGTFTSTNTTATIVTFTINATTGSCTSTFTAKVTIDAALIAPVIGSSQILCGNSSAVPFTMTTPVSGGALSGYTYQWYKSANSTGPWAAIAGATGTNYTPPNPAATTYYELIVTNACGTVTSNIVQVSTAADFGLSFSGSNVNPAYCSGTSFENDEVSGSIFGSFGSKYIKYAWQSLNPGDFTANVTNPYGYELNFFFFSLYEGDALFTVHNNTNAPIVNSKLYITPKVYNSDGTLYCTLDPDIITTTINPVPVIANTTTSTCSGTAFTYSPVNGVPATNVVPASTNYTWNAPSGTGFTGGASGNNSSITGTLTNTTNGLVTATYTVTPKFNGAPIPNCPGNPFTLAVTVNPVATVTTVANQFFCNGATTSATAFSSPTTGGTITYNWTNNNTAIGLAASGSGSVPSFTATNSGTSPISGTITVTPTFTNGASVCVGTPKTLTITVNPTATVNTVSNQTVCNGAPTTVVNFTSPNLGGTVTYSWTNNTPSIGLAASGTTNTIPSFNAINTGSSPVTATITVTPSFNNSGSCSGTPLIFTITVNPTATVNTIANQTLCNGASTTLVTFTSPTTGGTITYNWTNNTPSIGLAASGVTSTIPSFAAINNGTAPVIATITVTPTFTNGTTCSGTPKTFTITVNPAAAVNTISNQGLCNGSPTTAIIFSSPNTGGTVTYSWTNDNISIGLAASGSSATIPSFTAVNNGSSPVVATITVTPSFTNNTTCSGMPKTFTITVNPSPFAGIVTGTSPICQGAQVVYSPSVSGGVWSSLDPSIATVDASGNVKGISVGTTTIRYTVTNSCGTAFATKTIDVQNPGPATSPGLIAGIQSICTPVTSLTYSVSAVANASFYIWTVPSGWTITSGATTNSITVTPGATGGIISVQAGNTCGFSPSSSSLSVGFHNLWVGTSSQDWNNPSNWSDNIVGDAGCGTVTIPAGTPFAPKLSSNVIVPSINIASGTYLNLNGQTLTINGAYTGTGTLTGSATSTLIIGGNVGTLHFTPNDYVNNKTTNNYLDTLTLNNNATAIIGDSLNIASGSYTNPGTVTVNSGGSLNSNGNLIIKSDINGDARIAPSTGTITGAVTVERFIPGRRAWRFLSAPFSSSGQTIRDAWQEGVNNYTLDYSQNQNPHSGFGTHITGDNISTKGFDLNTTVNPSLKVWDGSLNNFSITEPQTKFANITDYPAYCIFVRGSRAVDLSQGSTAPFDNTVLRIKGSLNEIGTNITKNYPGISGGFIMAGNPFASAININNILNGTRGSGFDQNKTWVWDPKLGGSYGVGAYVAFSNGVWAPSGGSYPSGSGNPPLIQSGQGFMVQLSIGNTVANMTYAQTDKTSAESNVAGFAAPPPVIYTNLTTPAHEIVDGVATVFDNKYSAGVDGNDAQKLWNFLENIALVRNTNTLAIEFRPMPVFSDTLFYRMYLYKNRDYVLQVTAQNSINMPLMRAWIVDKYLNVKTEINMHDTALYNFTTNDDTLSYRNRFMVVFNRQLATNPLPVTKVINQDNPNTTGVTNSMASSTGSITIAPNPVTEAKNALLKFNNIARGTYEIVIYDSKGQKLAVKKLQHTGSRLTTYALPAGPTFASGVYTVSVINENGNEISNLKLVISR